MAQRTTSRLANVPPGRRAAATSETSCPLAVVLEVVDGEARHDQVERREIGEIRPEVVLDDPDRGSEAKRARAFPSIGAESSQPHRVGDPGTGAEREVEQSTVAATEVEDTLDPIRERLDERGLAGPSASSRSIRARYSSTFSGSPQVVISQVKPMENRPVGGDGSTPAIAATSCRCPGAT